MKFSRVPLAHLPTRIEHLSRLSEVLDGPQIYCKRDDQTGLGFGGNKIRKLEFLLADALQHQARTLVSVGAIQSNHCRQVAALAARAGLDCILVLSGTQPEIATGNLYLDQLFGAEIVWADRDNRLQVLDAVIERARKDGRAPYKIPYGGSNAVGAMGYMEAMQVPPPPPPDPKARALRRRMRPAEQVAPSPPVRRRRAQGPGTPRAQETSRSFEPPAPAPRAASPRYRSR